MLCFFWIAFLVNKKATFAINHVLSQNETEQLTLCVIILWLESAYSIYILDSPQNAF